MKHWAELPRELQIKIIAKLGIDGQIAFCVKPAKLKIPAISIVAPVLKNAFTQESLVRLGREFDSRLGSTTYKLYVKYEWDDFSCPKRNFYVSNKWDMRIAALDLYSNKWMDIQTWYRKNNGTFDPLGIYRIRNSQSSS